MTDRLEAGHAGPRAVSAPRRNGISNEMVGILAMGVAIMGVSLASWTTLRAEISDLRVEGGANMDRLRSDLQGQMVRLRSDLQGQMVRLRSDLHGDMERLRSNVAADVQELRTDIGAVGQAVRGLDDRMRAVETRLAVVEAHIGSAAIVSTGEGEEA